MLSETLVWTMPVEVGDVFVEDCTGVPLAVDQDPVSALMPDAADEPFRVAVRLLHLEREPASPHEWQRWLTGIRTAVTKHNLTADARGGASDAIRLVHVSCQRPNTAKTRDPAHLPL
jgi:hypothetical protein